MTIGAGVTTTAGPINLATSGAGNGLAINADISTLGNFTADAADTINLQGGITAGGTAQFDTLAGGVTQGTAVHPLTAQTITLNGTGSFSLINPGNDAIGTFGANVVGSIIFEDKNDLTVNPSLGIATGGSNLALYAGGNFTVQANDPSQVLINAPSSRSSRDSRRPARSCSTPK
jgi:hypothetical protein